jgi:hypothetical protein
VPKARKNQQLEPNASLTAFGFPISSRRKRGLGDVIKKITYKMGIKPCAGCEKRAAALNRWMRFTR